MRAEEGFQFPARPLESIWHGSEPLREAVARSLSEDTSLSSSDLFGLGNQLQALAGRVSSGM